MVVPPRALIGCVRGLFLRLHPDTPEAPGDLSLTSLGFCPGRTCLSSPSAAWRRAGVGRGALLPLAQPTTIGRRPPGT